LICNFIHVVKIVSRTFIGVIIGDIISVSRFISVSRSIFEWRKINL